MPTIEAIVREINKDMVPRFEEYLRAFLSNQDKEWLIEQIVRLTLALRMSRYYLGEVGNYVICLGGNQSDAVWISVYHKKYVTSY